MLVIVVGVAERHHRRTGWQRRALLQAVCDFVGEDTRFAAIPATGVQVEKDVRTASKSPGSGSASQLRRSWVGMNPNRSELLLEALFQPAAQTVRQRSPAARGRSGDPTAHIQPFA
jgi:hypothetical protein